MRVVSLFLVFTWSTACAMAQQSGTFSFLDVPFSTKTVGMGNKNISSGGVVGALYQAPTLVDSSVSTLAGMSYGAYLNKTNNFQLIVPFKLRSHQLVAGFSSIGYGQVDAFDPSGNSIGKQSAGSSVFSLGYSNTFGNFAAGGNLKMALSNLGSYRASAIMVDAIVSFKHPKQAMVLSMLFKNMGVVLSDYTQSSNSSLPFDLQIGGSYKPEYMPVRFTLTGYGVNERLQQPYERAPSGGIDEVMSHINVAGELILSNNFNVFFGYNHKVRKELKLTNAGGGSGISYGMLIRVKMIAFSYAKGSYHLGGKHHSLSLAIDTKKFKKK